MDLIDQESLMKLGACESDLQRLFLEVSKYHRFRIIDGFSSNEFLSDKHHDFPSKAVDVLFLEEHPQLETRERYYFFGGFVLGVASQLNINLGWGPCLSDFKESNFYGSFIHFELLF